MSTRFVVEIKKENNWSAEPLSYFKKEDAIDMALKIMSELNTQTRVIKIVEKVAFCSPKSLPKELFHTLSNCLFRRLRFYSFFYNWFSCLGGFSFVCCSIS